jgi:hypothetical protein
MEKRGGAVVAKDNVGGRLLDVSKPKSKYGKTTKLFSFRFLTFSGAKHR